MTELSVVVWFTGLPGAGKSTLSRLLAESLAEAGQKVEVLDGDDLRSSLSRDLGFSKDARDANVARIAFVARLLARNGVAVAVAAVSPYREAREQARAAIGGDGCTFVEVYVSCPMPELLRRDPKGLYKRALEGELEHFTGVSDPYEEPLDPELVLETGAELPRQSLHRLMAKLAELGVAGAGCAASPPR